MISHFLKYSSIEKHHNSEPLTEDEDQDSPKANNQPQNQKLKN
jgi:hypothetical protein